MHIAALAVALKVPVSKLEALESDNYESLPDTVFVRALASSVCRTLKLDPAPVLARLPQSQSPRLAADPSGLNAPVKRTAGKSGSSGSSSSFSAPASRSVVWVVLALLVGALALVFYPRHPTQPEPAGGTSSEIAVVAPKQPSEVTEPPTSSSAEAVAAAGPAPVPAPAASGASVPAAMRSGALTASAASALNSASAATAASVPASASAVQPADVLVLRARAQSWVQVRDGSGTLALQRNLTAGESVSVAGSPPFAVVVGRADATEVFVRGKPFDMTTVSRENVARFEVK